MKATDLDQGENARIYYYLISNQQVPFIVDRLDGTIHTNDTLDREKQSSYEIIIKASNDNEYQQTNVNILYFTIKTKLSCNYVFRLLSPIKFKLILNLVFFSAGFRSR